MQEREFLAATRLQRLDAVRRSGEYLGARAYGSHRVHLYAMNGFYCEVWIRWGTDQVEWIEVARNTDILSEYVKTDVKGLFH